MYLQIILMVAGVAIVVIALLASRLVRTMFIEAVFHRRDHCEIQVCSEGVSVKRFVAESKWAKT